MGTYFLFSLLFNFYLIIFAQTIAIQLGKRNVFIGQNSQYQSNVQLMREDAELIPINLTLQTTVTNTIPTFGNYFDYFYYLTPKDLTCYNDAVNNNSFVFPCPFTTNRYSQLRTFMVNTSQITQSIDDIYDISFAFIIDNTLFPYPDGAFSYSPINIDVITSLTIDVSSTYAILGQRLIFINVTVFIIFLVIIITLIVKTNQINNKMNSTKIEESQSKNVIHERQNEDNDSFISEEQKQQETQDRMLREELIEPAMTSDLQIQKIKGGVIQYMSSRMEDNE